MTHGLHDMTRAEYDEIDAVNWSTLKHLDKSPVHYRAALTSRRQPSAAMQMGTAIHALALEPEKAAEEVTYYEGTRRGKAWEAHKAEHPGKVILSPSEYDTANRAAEAVRRHPHAARLLAEGRAEVTATWEDAATGIDCRARVDWIGPAGLVELKSTRDIEPAAFDRTSNRLLYHGQLAYYHDGVSAAGEWVTSVHMICVEQDYPFDVVVYRVGSEVIDDGRSLYRRLLGKLSECRDRGRWDGCADKVLDYPRPRRT